jgi:probable rRNA maturation factor
MEIQIRNDQTRVRLSPAKLRRRTATILSALGFPEAELSLVFVDDSAIAALNVQYLGRPGPTNVISFPQQEGEDAGLTPGLLGDVVISVETAEREAETAGSGLDWALDRLLVHGVLHLVGYDHERAGSDAAAMEAKEAELMARLGWEG